MILLEADHVTKHFGPDPVLEDVSVQVRPGDKIGLIGPNGAGKTTLLRVLTSELEADRGEVHRHAAVRIDYLQQHPEITPGRMLWDEAALGLAELAEVAAEAEAVAAALAEEPDPQQHVRLAQRYDHLQELLHRHDAYRVEHRIERVLQGLGFTPADYQLPVQALSGGQWNRLLLARLLLSEPEVMLLDEPSNHLDLAATQWLESFLQETSSALVLVSHDRYFLDQVTNTTWELYQAQIEVYSGNFSAYWRQKSERALVQARTYEKQQQEIARTEDFIRRNHYGQKAAQAKDREKKLARIERVPPPREISAPPIHFPKPPHCGEIVLRASGLAKGFDRSLFREVTLDIERGQRWCILGPNGAGKTTLLRCLLGQTTPDEGQIVFGTGVRWAYFDQLLAGLDPAAPAMEAIRPPQKEFNEPQRRALLAQFGLTGEVGLQPVGTLSGGQRTRVALARLAAQDANLLILDEPTNHLDLWARDALEQALREYEGTVLFVSHDRYFVNRVADHLLEITPAGWRTIYGNYDTLVHLDRQRATPTTKPNKPAPKTAAAPATTKRRKFPYRKAADIEAEIQACENELQTLRESLADPEVYRSGPRIKELHARAAAIEEKLPVLYAHWEEASELNG